LCREKGIKVGLFRPITLYPFPKDIIYEMADQVKGILSIEMSAGQMIEDIMLAVKGKVPVAHYGRMGGIIHSPIEVAEVLEEKFIKG
jgi:2-oxoglutarate ferredoxin oxidoreductase subunit alpha